MARTSTSLSVRARLAMFTAFLIALLLLLGGMAVRGDAAAAHLVRQQAEAIVPARTATQDLTTRFRTAERAVTGYTSLSYALGSDTAQSATDSMLEPWRDLARRLDFDLRQIEHLTAQAPFDDVDRAGNIQSQVAAMRGSMTAWMEWTAQFTQPPAPGEAAPLPTAADIVQGDRLFAVAMADSAAVQSSIDGLNTAVYQQLLDSLRLSQWLLVIATLTTVLAALFVAWGTSASLIRPIVALRDTVRRQVSGEREAWADERRGASEVRALAADVNHLNREHQRLVDGQAQSLALLRAGNDVVSVINAAEGPQAAVDVIVRQVGKTLGADAVRIAGWGQDERPFAAVWDRSDIDHQHIPDLWWSRLRDDSSARVHALEAVSVVEGIPDREGMPAWILDDPVAAGSASAVFLPILVDGALIGMLAVTLDTEPRRWAEPEVAYLQRVTRALARQAVGAKGL